MGSPSPPDSLDSICDRLGDLQRTASAICQQTSSRHVSRVFAQVSNIIWNYYDETLPALQKTCTRCRNYLQSMDQAELVRDAPECEEDIQMVYEEIEALYDDLHPNAENKD